MRETTKKQKWPAGHKRAGDGYLTGRQAKEFIADVIDDGRTTAKPKKLTQKQVEQQEAIDHLRKVLKPGDKVYGIVRSVSRSGMSRTIDFYTFQPSSGSHEYGIRDGGIDRVYLSGWIATALDYRRDNSGALKVQGCGQDMIFATVYHLAMVIYRDLIGLTPEQASIPPEMLRRNGEIPEHIDIGDIGYLLKSDQL